MKSKIVSVFVAAYGDGESRVAGGQFVWALALAGLLLMSSVLQAESDDDFFEARIRPLLVKHCTKCHGAKKQEGGLRLDSRDGWMRGGDRGRAISPGKPGSSLLIRAVRYADPDLRMPPNKKLSAREIADLEAWVKRGATDPRRPTATPGPTRMDLEQARKFWSFLPIKTPPVPRDPGDRWSRNAIDRFVRSRWKSQGLAPVADADRLTLIRRATFDLTGLPPNPNEIDAFLRDESPHAFRSVVNRLLASPAYGERWGRHWLDVARYADTAGDGADRTDDAGIGV